jgi:hypothetical protein
VRTLEALYTELLEQHAARLPRGSS